MHTTQFTIPIYGLVYDAAFVVVYDVVYDVGIFNKAEVMTLIPIRNSKDSKQLKS